MGSFFSRNDVQDKSKQTQTNSLGCSLPHTLLPGPFSLHPVLHAVVLSSVLSSLMLFIPYPVIILLFNTTSSTSCTLPIPLSLFLPLFCCLSPSPPLSPSQVLSGVLSRLERLGCRLRWCCVCGERQRGDRAVECTVPGCQAAYCPQCWRDLSRICYACVPTSNWDPAESCSDTDMYYVH